MVTAGTAVLARRRGGHLCLVESGSSSTNVAVDNDGLCHSARDLQEALALRKRRGFDSESESLESPEPRKRVKVSFIDESP